MKHTVKFLVALTALAVLIFGTAAFAAVYDQDFTLMNNTGETIVSIYLSPTKANKWSAQDELGDYVLKHGYEVDINFSPFDEARYWDIRAEFADGSYAEWYNFDLFSISRITLNRNGNAVYE